MHLLSHGQTVTRTSPYPQLVVPSLAADKTKRERLTCQSTTFFRPRRPNKLFSYWENHIRKQFIFCQDGKKSENENLSQC